MLNLFGAIANGLGRAMPGYMNGYRMAVQDNWNDLNQYNKVQQGQLGNAWLEASFDPMYNQLLASTFMQQANAYDAGRKSTLNMAGFPGEMQAKLAANPFMGPLAQAQGSSALQQALMQPHIQQAVLALYNNMLQAGVQPQQPQQQTAPQGSTGLPTAAASGPVDWESRAYGRP